jgi:hypothetical protein
MNQAPDPDEAQARIRRSRNVAMALTLGFFALLVYFITYARMG